MNWSTKLTVMLMVGTLTDITKTDEARKGHSPEEVSAYLAKGFRCYKFQVAEQYEGIASIQNILMWCYDVRTFVNNVYPLFQEVYDAQ